MALPQKQIPPQNSKKPWFVIAVGIPMVSFLAIMTFGIGTNPISPVVVNDMESAFVNFEKTKGVLSINTLYSKQMPGQINVITGQVLDEKGEPVNTKIDFVFKGDNTEFFSSTFSENGVYRLTDVSINQNGQYIVIARANINEQSLYATSTLDINEFHHTSLGIGIFTTIIFTISLLILVSIQTIFKLKITSVEPLRFALLTLCSLIPIISLIAIDVPLGQDSAIGLVIKEIPGTLNNIDLTNPTIANMTIKDALMTHTENKFEWVIQIGGNARDNYNSGITIPVYVFVFGMLGGYIRFLHKSAKGWFVDKATMELKRLNPNEELEEGVLNRLATKADNREYLDDTIDNDTHAESDKAIIKKTVFNSSMEDVAFIFLSPIIAFVTYFFLIQGGIDPTKSMATLALVSFGAGLITDEVITKLKTFATSAFVQESKGNNSNTKK